MSCIFVCLTAPLPSEIVFFNIYFADLNMSVFEARYSYGPYQKKRDAATRIRTGMSCILLLESTFVERKRVSDFLQIEM